MRPSLILRDQYMTKSDGAGGVHPWRQKVPYETYRSRYGPEYKVARNFQGISLRTLSRYGVMTGLFGATAGIFALFFFDGVPRVRKDILQKVPLIGGFFVHEVAPEDNPF